MSKELKESFIKVVPVPRPLMPALCIKNINPYWLSGFASGDGSFQVVVMNSENYKTGHQVILRFTVSQKNQDILLIKNLISFLGCGRIT